MKTRHIILFIFCTITLWGKAQCINMTDLHDPSITCTYGYVVNCDKEIIEGTPYDNIGVIDHGSQSEDSRHTIHTYTNETDKNVDALRTIPLGETSSIRLGNWKVKSQAESITFSYVVSQDAPLLLLKYAAVMENPIGHNENEQPRLRLEVRDDNNQAIDSLCTFFDFIASPSLGWNTIPQEDGTNLLWKDWTNIGVNLNNPQYIGHTIKIRLTNYDCGRCGHFGYAYVHLSCVEPKIETFACGDDVYMEAPAGYEYRWYKKGLEEHILGTKQNITVPADGAVYVCECQQIGKPLCSFPIEQVAVATPQYPIADFSVYKRLGCVDTLYLTNTSGISVNGIDKNVPIEPCDSVVWALDDGRQFTQYDISSIPIIFANTGNHTITLTAFLKKGGCHSSKTQTIFTHGTTDPHSFSYTAEICQGESYYYNGIRLTKDSLYKFIHPTSYNCDSIVHLRLIVHPSFHKTDTIYLCDGNVIDYHGLRITSGGTYLANFKTIYGCDSVFKAVVFRRNSFYIEKDTTICQGEVYNFNGRLLQFSGEYWDSARTVYGCDSVTKLTLHVNPTYLIPTYVEVCHDQTFMFRGRELDAPGIYYDTLLTRTGCDSIYKLVFNKTPIYLFEDTVTICEGSSYNFRGRDVSEEGFYYDSLQSINGCDSVYKLLLKVEPLAMQLIDTILCGGVYDFRGRALTQSGIYHDTVRTAFGCDSIFELNLTINPTYLLSQYVEQCEGDAFLFRGRLVDQPGVYYDSLFTHDGCDSVYQLVYNIAPTYLQEFEDSICSNKTYLFRGMEITRPGIYIDTLQTISGCDSLFKLTLHHLPSYSFVSLDTAEGCSGEVLFNGREIKHSGIYTDSLQTTCGCDSIYTANVIINEAYLFEESQKICDHAPYIFRGRRITQSGIYEDSLTTVAGCDSIYRLIAEVTHTLRDTIVDTVCVGETYIFYSLLLQKEGFYSDTLSDPMGRRCEIHSIELGAKAPSMITQVSVGLSCANAMEYELQFHYYGAKPYTYSIIYDEAALSNGFVNVIDAPYRDTIYAPIPQYKDSDYLRPNYYHARLELQNGICDPQKTGYNYDLLIRYPSWIIRQHWNDVVAVLNSSYNGGYLFDKYEWEVNGRMLETTDSNYSNLYMPELRFGDNVCAYLTRKGETYSIPTCPIEIIDNSQAIIGDNPIIVYPTTVNKAHPVLNVRASNDATYAIYNSYGHFISSGHLNQNDNIQVMLPVCSGVYLFVTNDASAIYTTKILVQ